MVESTDGGLKFPGEPEWMRELDKRADEAAKVAAELPDSVKQTLEMVETIKAQILGGAITGLFVCAETADDGFTFYHTVTDNVFARHGAVVGYSNRLVAKQLDACEGAKG